jgi:hypothetical protein
MIDALEKTIRRLLLNNVPQLMNILQVRFEPPDQDWLGYLSDQSVGGAPVLGVDCYLVELRENAKLRSTEWHDTVENGIVFRESAPMRIDLHYLVTAWDSAKISETLEPGLEEHKLLYAVLATLAAAQPLNASRILGAADLATVPAVIRDADLPTRVVPAEGYPKLAEFWSSMGQTVRWHPAVHLIVTVPVVYEAVEAGGIVDTILIDTTAAIGPAAVTADFERELVVGGLVVDSGGNAVAGARVDLLSAAGVRAAAHTNADGQFALDGLAPGTYHLRCSHPNHPTTVPQTVTVPLPSGPVRLVLS